MRLVKVSRLSVPLLQNALALCSFQIEAPMREEFPPNQLPELMVGITTLQEVTSRTTLFRALTRIRRSMRRNLDMATPPARAGSAADIGDPLPSQIAHLVHALINLHPSLATTKTHTGTWCCCRFVDKS